LVIPPGELFGEFPTTVALHRIIAICLPPSKKPTEA
jgi:hypothetical protein